MTIWAIGDLHLAIGIPEKSMEIFGANWMNYMQRIRENWLQVVEDTDLVLIPGDISWAMKFEDALVDLKWIDMLPGTKVLLKGNHDYWWPSNKKLAQNLPSSIHFVNNNVFNWNNVTIGGSRLYDTEEYSFSPFIEMQGPSLYKTKKMEKEQERKIFERELCHLQLSLQQLDKNASFRIAMTHYPPISAELQESRASKLLEAYQIDVCVFGHLHNIKRNRLFGKKNHILYLCVSADYLRFVPLKVFSCFA